MVGPTQIFDSVSQTRLLSASEDRDNSPATKRRVGRPKGSKDGPRGPDAPPRGRPRNEGSDSDDDDWDIGGDFLEEDEYEYDEIPQEVLWQLYQLEASQSQGATPELSTSSSSPAANHSGSGSGLHRGTGDGASNSREEATFRHLRKAAERSQAQPFFSQQPVFGSDEDIESDGADLDDESDTETRPANRQGSSKGDNGSSGNPWFQQPKYMPDWLYQFFGDIVSPLIHVKEGRARAPPPLFQNSKPYLPASFWIHPPEPVTTLSHHRFIPQVLYRPRIFLWLPHFFVATLLCPKCHAVLEKNGACPPRRITDMEDSFFIVTWRYYCRKGCQSNFRGWNQLLLDSLPPYLQLAFPAVLSRKGGLSHRVITQLRVGNQHKMGPSGVRSLLLEMHTHRFNVLQAQYTEAAFEFVRARQEIVDRAQPSLHSYVETVIPAFGHFGDRQNYAGFVPGEYYLAQMMNKAIERDEHAANQHTACLAPDQIAIDDSHKVNKHMAKVDGVAVCNALWTCMDSRYIRAQALTLTKAHEERNGPLQAVALSCHRYGFDFPRIAFSDDPIKDTKMILGAFPSLGQSLTPIAAAYGLKALELPASLVPTSGK
ncbi:hypothetical protein BDZ97DRAFT_331398 [Flammula alnicola]|nr:hypothetical protein BDZ97DRAFT_331398 [Flammula alnicola]